MTHILVVDDASMVRKWLASALRELGCTVSEAFDGVDAFQKLDEAPPPALILLDIHMPVMNGIEFLEQLRARELMIPVIVVSAEAEPSAIRRAKQLGARAWLVKPLRLDVLLAAVKKAVPLDDLGREGGASSQGPNVTVRG